MCSNRQEKERRKRSILKLRPFKKAKLLAVDLLEDTCGYVILLFFIMVSIIITNTVLAVARGITGDVPIILECGVILADAFLLLKYIAHTIRIL